MGIYHLNIVTTHCNVTTTNLDHFNQEVFGCRASRIQSPSSQGHWFYIMASEFINILPYIIWKNSRTSVLPA